MRQYSDSHSLSIGSRHYNLMNSHASVRYTRTNLDDSVEMSQSNSFNNYFQLSTQDQEPILTKQQLFNAIQKVIKAEIAPLKQGVSQLRAQITQMRIQLTSQYNRFNNRLNSLQEKLSKFTNMQTALKTGPLRDNSYSSIGSTNFHFGRQLYYPTFYKWAKKVEARRFGLHGDKNDNPTYLTTNLYEAETRSPMRFPYEPERLSSLGFGRKQNSEAYQDSSRSGASRHRS